MTNICQQLVQNAEVYFHQTALEYKDRVWKKETWQSYITKIASLIQYFEKYGVKEKSKVAIMAETSAYWVISDYAVLFHSSVSVPIYTTYTKEDMAYILNDSKAEALIIDSKENLKKWQSIKEKCPNVKNIISFHHLNEDIHTLDAIFDQYKLEKESLFTLLKSKIKKIQAKDLATIVYTSGTTGVPKGVMLGHEQIISEVEDISKFASISNKDKSMLFLPLAHILGRVEMWAHAYTAHILSFSESMEKMRASFLYLQPTFIVGVPRIYEKIYNGVISQAEASPYRTKIFYWAKDVGSKVSKRLIKKKPLSLKLSLEYNMAKKLVFNQLMERLGGRLRFAICGGAPLNKDISEFFHAAGLLILEGYGLTETTAGITFNSPFDYKFETVGKPIGDVQIKIGEGGEILVKSKKVMLGYHNPQDQEEPFTEDGWFATGDIGKITSDGFLQITDRKKDLIKTSGGKFIAPQKIERLLQENDFISHVLVHGDRKKFIVCLITLNKEEIVSYLKNNNISYTDEKHLSSNPEVRRKIREAVAEANQKLSSFESIKNFAILDRDFSQEEGELTASQKVKRKVCDKKYKDLLDSLYRP